MFEALSKANYGVHISKKEVEMADNFQFLKEFFTSALGVGFKDMVRDMITGAGKKYEKAHPGTDPRHGDNFLNLVGAACLNEYGRFNTLLFKRYLLRIVKIKELVGDRLWNSVVRTLVEASQNGEGEEKNRNFATAVQQVVSLLEAPDAQVRTIAEGTTVLNEAASIKDYAAKAKEYMDRNLPVARAKAEATLRTLKEFAKKVDQEGAKVLDEVSEALQELNQELDETMKEKTRKMRGGFLGWLGRNI